MSTLPVVVLPVAATAKEVEEIQEVNKRAFGPDPLIEFCFNRPNMPQTPKEERIAKTLQRIAAPEWIFHKAVDASSPNGPILGVAAWYIIENPHTTTQNVPWGDPTPGVHLQCFDASLGVLRRWRQKHFEERDQPFVYMAQLTVLPEAQRRGVGSALLREGLKEVDRRGWPAFIEASPFGLGLYKKFGWVETAKTVVNLKEFGGNDVECVVVGLVRPAGVKEMKV